MDTFLRILGGAPWWAFPLLGLLVWLGVMRLKPRVMAPARLLVTPAVFLVWGLGGMAAKPLPATLLLAGWLGGAVLGALPGAAMAPVAAMAVDRRRRRMFVPGGWATLAIGIGTFVAHYALGVAAAMQPDWREPAALCDAAVSGLTTGYFTGWVIRVALCYRRLPEADLATAGTL